METVVKIMSGSWMDLDEPQLNTFTTTAGVIVSDPVKYPLLIAEANALVLAGTSYHKCLSLFQQFGGTVYKDAKNAAKKVVYDSHVVVAAKLMATYTGNDLYLTRPGYSIEKEGGKRSLAEVPRPQLQSKSSQDVRGRVKFILRAAKPRHIKGVEGMYSIDGGTTWIEMGIISILLKFLLENQPSGQYVTYMFRFHATNGRKSKWSEKFSLDVF